MPEVLSCVEVALPNWKVEHLSLWNELVNPVVDMDSQTEDLSHLEETTVAAQFCELKSKIAFLGYFWFSFFFGGARPVELGHQTVVIS